MNRLALRLGVALFGLLLGGATALALVTHARVVSEKLRHDALRAARDQDRPLVDAARARQFARSGLDAALVEIRAHLRSGLAPPTRYATPLGAGYPTGVDLVEVQVEPLGNDRFALECVGTVQRGDFGQPPEVIATARLRAEVRVDASGWEVLRVEGP